MNLLPPKLRVIISGGGTGGHIFPAIAIANALKKLNPETEILFVGATGRMEMEKVPAAGYKIEGLNISGIQRKLSFKNLFIPFKVFQSIMKSRRIIKAFSPDVVIGVGGYASGPLLYAATAMHIPALIQEQNSFAGITNKILAKRVQKICVAYEGMEKFFPKNKIIITGNPVREETTRIAGKRTEAANFFGIDPHKKTILVIGGSLGARTINESIGNSIAEFKKNDFQLIWQTGKSFSEKAVQLIDQLEYKGVLTYQFIQRMDYAYAAADVIISRAGASSVSELALVAKPVILVPSPNVAEDHQTQNAMALVNKGAAILIKDSEAQSTLISSVINLLKDENYQRSLSEKIKTLAIGDSSERIASEVYKLVKNIDLK